MIDQKIDQKNIDFSRYPTLARRISRPDLMLPKPRPPIVSVAGLEKEMADMLAPLEKQLKEAVYDGQRELIQAKIDQIKRLHLRAIERARLDETLYEANRLLYEKQQFQLKQEMDKVAEEELQALYVKSGGKVENFARDKVVFEQTLIHQRMLTILSGEPKPPSINLLT
jgi:hypothetical protein